MWIRCPPCARHWATHFTPTHLILPTVFWTTHCCWGLLLIYAQRQPGNALLRSLAVGSTAMVPAAAPSHPSPCLIKPPFSQSIPSSMTKPPGQSTPLPVRCRTPGEWLAPGHLLAWSDLPQNCACSQTSLLLNAASFLLSHTSYPHRRPPCCCPLPPGFWLNVPPSTLIHMLKLCPLMCLYLERGSLAIIKI